MTHAGPWSSSLCRDVHRYSEKLLESEAQAGAESFLLSLIYAEAGRNNTEMKPGDSYAVGRKMADSGSYPGAEGSKSRGGN